MTRKINALSSSARLEVFNGVLAGKVFHLEGEVIIGRQNENTPPFAIPDILLPDSRVSRRHARVFINNGDCFIEDLNSKNGTFLNTHNVALREPVLMRKGSNVQVGETHMRFFPASEPETDDVCKRVSSPWQSEIGLNEQVFDLSTPINSRDDA